MSQTDKPKTVQVRPLRFRAWDGEIFYYVDLNDPEKISLDYLETFLRLPKQQLFIVLNGQEIYEGDIVTVFNDDVNCGNFEIIWKGYGFCFNDLLGGFGQYNFNQAVYSFKVIGNIYENTDLLS